MSKRAHITQLGVRRREPTPSPEPDRGYPRPQMRRADFTRLDGRWEFAIDPAGELRLPREVTFDRVIEVPFAPETPRSGIGDTSLFRACWYRRAVRFGAIGPDQRVLLHFGAVDYDASVWIDGSLVARHEGGYTPFSVDVTAWVRGDVAHELVVRAEDDPADLAKPRGKQDWQAEPHSIWYPRTTGIWQSVWFERVSSAHVEGLRWTPDMTRWELGFDALVAAPDREVLTLALRIQAGDLVLADDRYAVSAGELHRRIALSDPGIDDFRNELLWSPSKPTLLEAEIELVDEQGRVRDAVSSYTALRSFAIEGDRFVLNGRPQPLRMVLDQGYWPESGLTAPDDDALRRDVELTKAMGFNGARKHQKVEDPRYFYWADRLGLFVWAEMPSAYRFTRRSVARLTHEWIDVIRRDASHPCIVAWVPLNESWGVPNLPDSKPERHYVEALYHLTRTLDPTRPVVGNDGWESVATDVLGIHDYDDGPDRIAERYATPELLPRILKRERPGGRLLVIDGRALPEMPVVLSEFGGIAVADGATWGYSTTATCGELAMRYRRLLEAVRASPLFAGFCYTQLTDTYQEANGLLRADRTPKFPLEEIAQATTGSGVPRETTTVLGETAVTERGGAP